MTDDDQDVIDGADDGDTVDPSKKLKSSKGWLKLIKDQEKAGYADYQERCTNIQKRYAELARLASITRDREFQIFWANIEVLKPSMYSRPPVPVVAPRFQDRRPLQRTTAEFLERCTVVTFDRERIDGVMRRVRDDLALLNRGCAWLRYEAKGKDNDFVERVCIDHKNRRDFVHDPARTWREVDWVGGGAWMTRKEMRKRFRATSGDAYQDAEFAVRKDDKNNHDGKLKARVWEIWSKSEDKVIWVSPGVDVNLDEGEPHLTLEGFFPCPEPAYGTVQPESLIPVPDYLFYKDQIEEINDMTNRISALSDGLRVRGFYPAGAGEIGDAIEAALKSTNDRQVMVPVSNWAAFGNGAAKDTIVWLPLDMIATTITQLIALRKELIDDIYQISGLSDIMRGESNPNETLGAQQIKTQYGSVRIRDRQNELIRVARDIASIAGEIMAENFQQKTLADMAQMDLPTNADISKQVKALEAQGKQIAAELEHAQADPEIKQMAQQNPEAAQQIMQQAQGQLQQIGQHVDDLKKTVTIEQVMDLLQDQRMRPFNLDIETDSTIQPDENAAKQRATEYVTAISGLLAQAAAVKETPQLAPVFADVIKYVNSQFRVGREVQATVDEFADKMKQMAGQPQPDPNAAAQKADMEAKAADQKLKQGQAQHDAQLKEAAAKQDSESKRVQSDIAVKNLLAKGQQDAQKHAQDMEKGALELEKLRRETELAQTAPATPPKAPSESISFKDLPPEGQVQMAAHAGIVITPEALLAHQSAQQATTEQASKPQTEKPQPHHEALVQSNQAVAAALDHLTKTSNAPKRIIKGGDGTFTVETGA